MAWLFATTIFLSAALLFSVQPMLAKLLLPTLGGSPAVWNTCMFFFQAVLLAGYTYAHVTARLLRPRGQAVMHGLLLLAGAWFLPLRASEGWVQTLLADPKPTLRLLGCLLALAGLPLFAISSTSPLLQRWLSGTRHAAAADPYFLYAASNLGSLLALLTYPLLLEPRVRLGAQNDLWAAGYGVLVSLILACGVQVWRAQASATVGICSASSSGETLAGPIEWEQRGRWVLLAFAPSSLMLGTTQFLVTDIASIPLLWIVPLSLYLMSFVATFAQRGIQPSRRLGWLTALLGGSVAYSILMRATHPVWLLLALHLAFLACAALACHAQLASDRPAPSRLTEFYLWLAVGGLLGGSFNTLLAPLLLNSTAEYPVAIVLAVLLRPGGGSRRAALRWPDLGWPVVLGLLAAGLAVKGPIVLSSGPAPLRYAVIFGLPLLIGFVQVDRPLRFGLGLGAILLGGGLHVAEHGQVFRAERSFFGVSRVTIDPGGKFRRLVHGNTWHGGQFLDPARQCEPLVYYHRTGPLGDVFALHDVRHPRGQVGVVGLGTGSMVCYARPGDAWVFYEIDPVVIRLAHDTNCFTYLSHCAAALVRIIPGDARLRLREAEDSAYTLLVIDAFSSDAIPVHLLTREAMSLYAAKLAPGGLLAFHISNRYLDLEEVVADLARELGLVGLSCHDWDVTPQETEQGKAASHWVVLARRHEDLGRLTHLTHWFRLESNQGPVWSDDFSNLFGRVRWR
jgi:spermidine synthase